MKKERNCGTAYPTYQPMPGYGMPQPPMMPGYGMGQPMPGYGMPPQGMGPVMPQNPGSCGNGNLEQQVSSLSSSVNSLERRVAALESLVGNSNTPKYSTSNYQMM